MPKLPTARQNRLGARRRKSGAANRRSLARAFRTFAQAAGSLEKSYAHLQNEVARLRSELECANAELSRSAEENVRVRAFLTRVLEGLPCGVIVTDSNFQPRMMNPEARRLLQLDASWMPGQDSRSPESLKKLIKAAIPASFSREYEWAATSGADSRVLGVSAARTDNSPDGNTEAIWIIRDISDQKRLATEREAARRAHALAQITTVLAHEIRNPLASMELFAGLLADATCGMPECREWVMHLQAGLRLLAATVNNVLQFHSEPCGEMIATNLDRLLREVAGFLDPLARERGLKITIDNSIGNALVPADSQRLRQVFFNLALNAFCAMKARGTLTIRIKRAVDSPNSIQVDFEDQGRGIRAENLPRIFEPGFTTKAGSPGLGLSVCRTVIEQHGGNVRVYSQPGQGSTFSIFLPTAEELRESRACGR